MTKQDILEYLGESPSNTNPAVISGMLDSFAEGDNKEEIELEATENKVYTPDEGKVYKKVTVNVESEPSVYYALVIDMNGGTYDNEDLFYTACESGKSFSVATWAEEGKTDIVAPQDKYYAGVTTVKDDDTTLVTSVTITDETRLYALWTSEQPK